MIICFLFLGFQGILSPYPTIRSLNFHCIIYHLVHFLLHRYRLLILILRKNFHLYYLGNGILVFFFIL